jgi:hypothetical protein
MIWKLQIVRWVAKIERWVARLGMGYREMFGYVGSEPNCLLLQLSVFESSHLLKVHKNENFFGSNFEFCTMSLLVTDKSVKLFC